MNLEEGVGGLGDTGVGVVPGEEGSEETKDTTGLDESVGSVGGSSWADEMAETEHEEGEIESEEEGEEGDGGFHGAEKEEEGKDEPAHKIEAEDVLEFRSGVGLGDAKPWSVDHAPRDPETTVGREGGGGEGVAASHFPHTSKKLNLISMLASDSNEFNDIEEMLTNPP